MLKKLFISLFVAMLLAPLSFAQDDATDTMQDDTMQENSADPVEETTDEMQDDSMADSSAESGGTTGSTTYLCDLQGMTRRVEISYDTPGTTLPCSVNYYKDSEVPGEVNTLWTASNIEGYCEEKAAAFVDKLSSWGWTCQAN